MNFWKNTVTLDNLVPELLDTVDVAEAEIAVIGGKPINLASMPKLKAIFKCGVGVDNIPFEEAKERGVQVILPSDKTKSYIFEETANFSVYLILSMLYKDLGSVEKWEKKQRPFLGDYKVLILGQGNIGKKVAEKLNPLVSVSTYDSLQNSEKELEELFKHSDVISIHIPLNEHTMSFVDEEKLSWMKDGATLVNTARGPIVNETALLNEIKNERLFAAFDVFWYEPYDGKLKEHHPERFFMSPHVASNCQDFLNGLALDLRELIRNYSINNCSLQEK